MADTDLPDELAMFLKFDPYIVRVPDGHYTQRVVLNGPIVAHPMTEGPTLPEAALSFTYEPCFIPKYRNEVRYGLEL